MRPTAYGSAVMAKVHSKDTKPEMMVRSLVHSMGYRFRLHRANLPGRPDLVFPRFWCVILVHGCFWHGHSCPNGTRRPKSNRRFWVRKIEDNQKRDARCMRELRKLGWRILTIWECQLKNMDRVAGRIVKFLEMRSVISMTLSGGKKK